MSEFDLDPGIQTEIRQRTLRVTVPLAVVAVAAGVGIGVSRAGGENLEALAVVIPVIVLMAGFAMYRGYRRQSQKLGTYRLFLTDEEIRREIESFPPLNIRRDEVRRIDLHPSGAITIRTDRAMQTLVIPAQIRNRELLLRELSEWRTPSPVASSSPSLRLIVSGFAVIAAFAVTALSHTPAVVIAVGSALFLALVACGVSIWRNNQLDASTRRRALFVLLPAAAILIRVISAIQELR